MTSNNNNNNENGFLKDRLNNNQTVNEGFYFSSLNRGYNAIMQQDGNFVIYLSNLFEPRNALFATGTNGKGTGPYRLIMQADNNLVLYDKNNKPTWASNTNGKGKLGTAYCIMQNDGNLVIYDENKKVLWASNTYKYSINVQN